MKRSIFMILFSSVVLSCSSSDDAMDQDLIGVNITTKSVSLVKGLDDNTVGIGEDNDNVLYCHFDETIGFDHAVIRNESEFQALGNAISAKGDCYSEEIPEIDFTQYTLIGKYVSGGGCSADFDNEVYEDKATKAINYLIRPEFTGSCEMLIFSWNWMLIPKIGPDYTVVFVVE